MKNKLTFLLALSLFFVTSALGQKTKQKVLRGKICGNPTVKCRTDNSLFTPGDIPFEVPKNSVISESEYFYAVILKSQTVADLFGGDESCRTVATEDDRLAAQKLFPNNK